MWGTRPQFIYLQFILNKQNIRTDRPTDWPAWRTNEIQTRGGRALAVCRHPVTRGQEWGFEFYSLGIVRCP